MHPRVKQTKDMRSIRLADLPESVAEELKMLDVDESGTLSTSEIMAAIVGTVWALLVKVKDTDTNDVDGQTTLTKSGAMT
eukprot:jgi/Pico_ML_1/51065/g2166.t1